MFRWAIIFAIIALIASLLGFGGVAGLSKDFAVILLVVAVILAVVGFLSRGKVQKINISIYKQKNLCILLFYCNFLTKRRFSMGNLIIAIGTVISIAEEIVNSRK